MVDRVVKATCTVGAASATERFMNGQLENTVLCLETGVWTAQFDDCDSKWP